jgi:hypothetical protein
MKQNDRKPEEASLLNGVPYAEDVAAPGAAEDRRRRSKWLAAAFVLGIAMILPVRAHAGIFDVFKEIFGTIQNDIGSSLSQINQVVQQVQKLYQTTVAPLAALNQARGFVANSANSFRGQMNQIFNTQFTSAVTHNQFNLNSGRSRHASVRKPNPFDQPRDRQGPIVRLVRASQKPPPHFGKPNTGRLRERGRIREGRCGPKERHAVTPATGIGEQMHRMSVLCSPLSGDLTEFRTRDTTTQRMKEAGRHVCQVLCKPGNGKQLHATVREPAGLRNPG